MAVETMEEGWRRGAYGLRTGVVSVNEEAIGEAVRPVLERCKRSSIKPSLPQTGDFHTLRAFTLVVLLGPGRCSIRSPGLTPISGKFVRTSPGNVMSCLMSLVLVVRWRRDGT